MRIKVASVEPRQTPGQIPHPTPPKGANSPPKREGSEVSK